MPGHGSTNSINVGSRGYRAVAPFLRGYPPTSIPTATFDTEDVTIDIAMLIEALAGEPSIVVGHDWGAIAAFNLAAVRSEAVTRVVSIG